MTEQEWLKECQEVSAKIPLPEIEKPKVKEAKEVKEKVKE